MPMRHAVVWLDHHEARIYFFDHSAATGFELSATDPHSHLHHKQGSISGKRSHEDQQFFHDIVTAMKPATAWLVMGPGLAKLEFIKHVHSHDSALSDHIIGVETADHPTDGQIVAHARRYFKAADRMTA